MVVYEDLPATFTEKMRLQWSQISSAFSNLDMKRAGKLSRSDFEAMNKRTGLRLSSSEIDKIFQIFDRNNDGKVDFREFSSVIGDCLKPPSQPTGFSLNFGSESDLHRRSHGKKMLACSYQSMDTDESSKPLIQVISTSFYSLLILQDTKQCLNY
jgi:hypothetical protein